MNPEVVVVDYHAGNPASIKNMFKKIGASCEITSDVEVIRNAKRLVLSGVGHFDYGMRMLHELDLVNTLNEVVNVKKIPFLGICLGMQLLGSESEEGDSQGLNWIQGKSVKFKASTNYKVPHMGWSDVEPSSHSDLLMDTSDARYYFVHTYHFVCQDPKNEILKAKYAGIDFTAAIQEGNIMGVQFHPEKSHRFGLKLLQNFIRSV